jgi:hypothetical protein
MKPAGTKFVVIDPWGEQVNTYSEEAAKQDIERCKKEDLMYEGAKMLVDTAIKGRMERFGVDRKTASYWIHSASEVAD